MPCGRREEPALHLKSTAGPRYHPQRPERLRQSLATTCGEGDQFHRDGTGGTGPWLRGRRGGTAARCKFRSRHGDRHDPPTSRQTLSALHPGRRIDYAKFGGTAGTGDQPAPGAHARLGRFRSPSVPGFGDHFYGGPSIPALLIPSACSKNASESPGGRAGICPPPTFLSVRPVVPGSSCPRQPRQPVLISNFLRNGGRCGHCRCMAARRCAQALAAEIGGFFLRSGAHGQCDAGTRAAPMRRASCGVRASRGPDHCAHRQRDGWRPSASLSRSRLQ